jgi:hypothetical protein
MGTRPGEGYGDDDRLPWLETVEEDYREGPSFWRILLLIVLGLAVLAAISFGWWWYQRQSGNAGNGQLIEAQEGDYKVKPDEPGGLQVEGEGTTAFATGEGTATNSSVNLAAQPEAPVDGKKAEGAAGTAPGSGSATVAVPPSGGQLKARNPATPPPASAPARSAVGTGALIQLGAFPDQQGADAAWARLARKHSALAGLGKSVEQGTSNGKIVFRLRVNAGSNGQAKEICGKLTAAGDSCYVAN